MYLLVGIVLITTSLACRPICSPPPCPTSRLAAHLTSGSVTLALRDKAPETYVLSAANPPLPTGVNGCAVWLDSYFESQGQLRQQPLVTCHSFQGEIDVHLGA